MIQKVLFSLILGALAFGSLEAQRVKEFPISKDDIKTLGIDFSASDLESLATRGTVFKSTDKPSASAFKLPGPIANSINTLLAKSKPEMFLEQVKVYPIPQKFIDKKTDLELAIFNIFHAFSTMEGIEYFSASRNEMRVFFTKSSQIVSHDDKTKIKDQKFSSTKSFESFFIEQEDSTFGSNIYNVQLNHLAGNFTHIRMTNSDQIWYGIAPVLGANALNMDLVVIYTPKYLVFYSSAGFSPPRIFGIDEKAKTSFQNRLDALFGWFVGQVSKT